jgi:pimeloyl-ACP methyl ester carboxylesterase
MTWFLVLVCFFLGAQVVASRLFNPPPGKAGEQKLGSGSGGVLPPPVTLRGAGSELGAYDEMVTSVEDPTAIVVFVAGNPGAPAYYSNFASELSTKAHATVILIGLVGHLQRTSCAKLPRGERGRVFGLEEQVAHIAARAAPHMEEAAQAGVPFVIAGHSIGAWISLQAEQRLRRSATETAGRPHNRPRSSPGRVRGRSKTASRPTASAAPRPRLLLITPFLDVPSCLEFASQRSRLRLFNKPFGWTPSIVQTLTPVRGLVGTALQYAPERLVRSLCKKELRNLSEEYAQLTLKETLHRHQIRNCLLLAQDEFQRLLPPMDLHGVIGPLVRANLVRAVYVPDDEWAPRSMALRCREEIGLDAQMIESTSNVSMRHAFSVQHGSCARVADWAARAIDELR